MSISNYLENALLNAVFNSTSFSVTGNPYVSLHTADPGETGASEVTGGSYARQQADFIAAASGALDNSAIIDFASMPAVTVVGVGVWDALSGGNFLWGGTLDANKTTNSGDTYRIIAGALDVTLD